MFALCSQLQFSIVQIQSKMNSISEPNDNEIRQKLNKKLNLFRNNKFDSLDSKLQGLIHEEGRRVKEYDEAKFTKYLQKLRKTLKKERIANYGLNNTKM